MKYFAAIFAVLLFAAPVYAQYTAIPNGSGTSVLSGINNRFSGTTGIEPKLDSYTYSTLPTEIDGKSVYCSDCTQASPCASGGTGAVAQGINGAWSCSSGSGGSSGTATALKFGSTTQNLGSTAATSGQYMEFNGTDWVPSAGTSGGATDRLSGIFNVKTGYSAVGDDTTDDTTAIQNAVNAACAATNGGVDAAEVYFPAGKYKISQPIKVDCASLHIVGAGMMTSQIDQSVQAPVFSFVSSAYPGITTTTALVGSGNAAIWNTGGQGDWMLDLRQAPSVELNGLSAMTVEFATEFTSTVGATGWMGSSDFQYQHQAFAMWYDGSNVQAIMTVGGVQHQLTAAETFSLNTVYNIALDYDGSTIRLFVNGNQVASAAASGTVTQTPTEAVVVGAGSPSGILGNSINHQMLAGVAMDNIRISNDARYTTTYTPSTTKFTSDSNTLALLTFATNPDIYTEMESGSGGTVTWLPALQLPFLSYQVGYDQVSNIGADYGTIGFWFAVQNHMWADHIETTNCNIGIYMFNNCFRSYVSDVEVGGNGSSDWVGVMQDMSSSPIIWTRLHVGGTDVNVLERGGAGFNDMYNVISTNTLYGVYISGGDNQEAINFTNPNFDYEPATPNTVALIYLDQPYRVTFLGGVLEDYNDSPFIDMNASSNDGLGPGTGFGTVTFVGTYFNAGGTSSGQSTRTTPYFNIIQAPEQPIMLINPQFEQDNGTAQAIANTMSAITLIGSMGSPTGTVTANALQGFGNIQFNGVTYSNLGTVVNGEVKYCSDCTIANPCASGGSGALAKGLNGAWVCN